MRGTVRKLGMLVPHTYQRNLRYAALVAHSARTDRCVWAKPSVIRWSALIVLGSLGCGGPRPAEWHAEDGYRWTELSVPRRGRDGFRHLSPSETGITFTNSVTGQQVLQNEHVLNGSGVALGDVDGDGLVDIYFSRLDGPNVLYRNRGGWRFEDVTERAGVAAPERLSTGAVFADSDGDGDVDLLVTSIGGPHALFLNNGAGVFDDATARAGLASGFYGTTMTLADVDGDGDLDLYVANNKVTSVRDMHPPDVLAFDSVVQEVDGRFIVRPEFRQHYRVSRHENRLMRFEIAEPDKFYLNNGTGRFEEVSFTSGWFLDEDGGPLTVAPTDWGLTARFYDIDGDRDPDLYVCNDFASPDHVWINDGTGRFRLADRLALRTTSNANMAIDFADLDRDGDVDFFAVDMLDPNSGLQKTQTFTGALELPPSTEIEDREQLRRNTLFINRGDGTFTEAAYYAGVEASGWSWSVLFMDVDLDGYEDVLIGNGHERDFLDTDTQIRIQRLRVTSDWRKTRLLYPRLHLQNVAFRNQRDLTFEEVGEWGFGLEQDVTHGMAAADLDGDGDLDIVTNRLGFTAGVLRNEGTRPRVAVRLGGQAPNTQGIGAKIRVLGGAIPEQEKEVTLGGMYLSSSDPLYTFATGDAAQLTIVVDWRSGQRTTVDGVRPNRLYEIHEPSAEAAPTQGSASSEQSSATAPAASAAPAPLFVDVSAELGHTHTDPLYNDFGRQPLLPNRLSQLGPGVTWHDVDRDGDEDLLITSGRGGTLAYYRNDGGRLTRVALRMQAAPLDQTTVLALPNADNGTSLLVGQMNYEARTPAAALEAWSVLRMTLASRRPRARSVVADLSEAVPGTMSSTGPLALADYDGDGDLDLFVGGRVLPARYPTPAASRLFHNHEGSFALDSSNSAVLSEVGLVSSAIFSDLDADGDPDLLLALEWGPLTLFLNQDGRFTNATHAFGLAEYRNLWNGVAAGDMNGDGLLDVVATGWGRNTKLRVSQARPLRVYYADFDRSGTMDVVTAQYDPRVGDLVPLRGRAPMSLGIPYVGRRFDTFKEYAAATLKDVLGPPLAQASLLEVQTLDHMLFVNRGGRFEARPLPVAAQLAPAFYVGIADFDGDGHEDLFLTQNFYPTDPETQRYASGRGLWLRGDGNGGLETVSGAISGVQVYGDQRGAALGDFDRDGRVDLVVSQNGNATKLYRNERARPGLRIRLVGPPGNPDAFGAVLRLVYGDRRGPAREIRAGSGYWSQDGPVPVLGMEEPPTAVWVRWPGGSESSTPVEPGAREIVIRMPRNQ